MGQGTIELTRQLLKNNISWYLHSTGLGMAPWQAARIRDKICKKIDNRLENSRIVTHQENVYMSSHSTCRTPKKRLRPRRFAGLKAVWACCVCLQGWSGRHDFVCMLRRQRWRTDWSTLCNIAASAPLHYDLKFYLLKLEIFMYFFISETTINAW